MSNWVRADMSNDVWNEQKCRSNVVGAATTSSVERNSVPYVARFFSLSRPDMNGLLTSMVLNFLFFIHSNIANPLKHMFITQQFVYSNRNA